MSGDHSVVSNISTIRLCTIVKWSEFDGYGFNLHNNDNGINGHHLGDVDDNSPAFYGGLKKNDRIIEVNGSNIQNLPHSNVVELIKMDEHCVTLLVVDAQAEEYYNQHGIKIANDNENVICIICPNAKPSDNTKPDEQQGATTTAPPPPPPSDTTEAEEQLLLLKQVSQIELISSDNHDGKDHDANQGDQHDHQQQEENQEQEEIKCEKVENTIQVLELEYTPPPPPPVLSESLVKSDNSIDKDNENNLENIDPALSSSSIIEINYQKDPPPPTTTTEGTTEDKNQENEEIKEIPLNQQENSTTSTSFCVEEIVENKEDENKETTTTITETTTGNAIEEDNNGVDLEDKLNLSVAEMRSRILAKPGKRNLAKIRSESFREKSELFHQL